MSYIKEFIAWLKSIYIKPAQAETPKEEYGRDLCLLPLGWEDLSGDDRWLSHISDELRVRWSELSRKQKMAVAYTISELADELADRAIESSGY